MTSLNISLDVNFAVIEKFREIGGTYKIHSLQFSMNIYELSLETGNLQKCFSTIVDYYLPQG